MDVQTQQPRPQHRRNASSKTGIWKTLVSTKPQLEPSEPEQVSVKRHTRTQSVPLLPPDHPHASGANVLGERPFNAQSRIPSDKSSGGGFKSIKKPTSQDNRPKKTKSTTNLSSMFAKLNRSHKELSVQVQKDAEDTTPPIASPAPSAATPIWAQFATSNSSDLDLEDKENLHSSHIAQEIARYTPHEYCPDKQRNFNGSFDQPALRPTLNSNRPQGAYNLLSSDGIVGAIGRRVSGGRSSSDVRRSGESARSQTKEQNRRVSGDRIGVMKQINTDRKASGSSTEQAPAKEKLNITKRGGRVMAAVAALQGKSREATTAKENAVVVDAKDVDEAFEAVLAARNIPEPMRQKMRTLTLRVKADFVKQDQEQSKTPAVVSTDVVPDDSVAGGKNSSEEKPLRTEDDSQFSKRSRARSRTFTFSKSDKRSSNSPTKRKRSGSKPRPTSVHIPKETNIRSPTTPTTPTGSLGRLARPPAIPMTYIDYLRKNTDPVKVEVGRLHKLRILLRNETVTWVNSFVSQGGMAEIVGLLNRTMEIEWREDHEDQVLHEALLCLKALCTAECALAELDKVADDLFPALLGMLFDDEKKGPAEYSTRTIIINVLFNFLSAALTSPPADLEVRARRVLSYLSERPQPPSAQPVDFVLDMHVPRPYKLWAREVTHVTKEVFWIFLHHVNVIPGPGSSPPPPPSSSFATLHFPSPRAPVPAAPYIGGVEWDATSYLAAHLDLLNGTIACVASRDDRNALREDLRASGWERVMGATLRTCKEKFYGAVHEGLRAWVAAAAADGWEATFVREGPTEEERAEKVLKASPRKSPVKSSKVEGQEGEGKKREEKGMGGAPKLGLGELGDEVKLGGWMGLTTDDQTRGATRDEEDEGWVG